MALSTVLNEESVDIPCEPDISSLSKSAVLHRSLHELPAKVVKASGCYLRLDTGQQILDATGGAAVACLGHGNGRVINAAQAQMLQVSYCHSLTFGTYAAEKLAKLLIDSTHGQMSKAFIVNSGSEAMDAAMKMARQYFLELPNPQPQRTKFIARQHSWHGTTLGPLSLSGHVARRALFEPILNTNIGRVAACFAYRDQRETETVQSYVSRLAEELDGKFEEMGSETVCALVAEPVSGAALGCVPAVPGYFEAVKKVCDKHGALLILDEVMCGMGRCGTLHAWEQEGIVPDLQTIGKGLGGGYAPVSGMLVGHRVAAVLEKGTGAFSHGHTYQGHPVACAVAYEVQSIIKEQNLLKNVRAMGATLERLLHEKLDPHPHVGNIRGKGLFWGIEFVKDKLTKTPFDPKVGIAMGVHSLGMQEPHSISLYPGSGTMDGRRGDHVLIAPAYNLGEDVVDLIAMKTAAVVNDFFSRLESTS